MQPGTTTVFEQRQVTHTLVIGTAGAVDVRAACQGSERRYHHGLHEIAFFSCDDKSHAFTIRAAQDASSAFVIHMPRRHLDELAVADGMRPPGEWRLLLPRQDAVLRDCLLWLRRAWERVNVGDLDYEIAARRLVCRLIEVLGGSHPEWRDDKSVFTTREMNRIVSYIDSRLCERHQFSLEEISSLIDLSPSHCARKVRQTVGLSLGRLIQRRRLAAAMMVLKDDDIPLAKLALDLGFSSQSHFTRLFSSLTGITPARYRKLFKRVVG